MKIKYTMILLKNCSEECNGKMISPHVCKFYPDGSILINIVEYDEEAEYGSCVRTSRNVFEKDKWETVELTAEPVNHSSAYYEWLRENKTREIYKYACDTFVYDGEFEVITEEHLFEEFKKMYAVTYPLSKHQTDEQIKPAFYECKIYNRFQWCDYKFRTRIYAHREYEADKYHALLKHIEKVKAEHGFTPEWDKLPETFIYDKTNFNLSQTILNNK